MCWLKQAYVGCRGRLCRGMREKHAVEAYLACGPADLPSFCHAFGQSGAARWPGALWGHPAPYGALGRHDDWAMRQAVLESLQEGST